MYLLEIDPFIPIIAKNTNIMLSQYFSQAFPRNMVLSHELYDEKYILRSTGVLWPVSASQIPDKFQTMPDKLSNPQEIHLANHGSLCGSTLSRIIR